MMLRNIMQGYETNPKVPMANNYRPLMDLNHRPIRTNMNFPNSVSMMNNRYDRHAS